jgi:hypothetical protein
MESHYFNDSFLIILLAKALFNKYFMQPLKLFFNHLRFIITLIASLVFCKVGFSQNSDSIIYSPFSDSTIKLSVIVKVIDSEYIAIPQIKIIDNGTIIKLKKERFYDQDPSPIAEGLIYLQKQIHKVYVNFSLDAFRHPLYNSEEMEVFGPGSTLKDTINLKYFYPFENGNYRLMISLSYFKNGESHRAYSDWCEFEVLFPPKNSIFD